MAFLVVGVQGSIASPAPNLVRQDVPDGSYASLLTPAPYWRFSHGGATVNGFELLAGTSTVRRFDTPDSVVLVVDRFTETSPHGYTVRELQQRVIITIPKVIDPSPTVVHYWGGTLVGEFGLGDMRRLEGRYSIRASVFYPGFEWAFDPEGPWGPENEGFWEVVVFWLPGFVDMASGGGGGGGSGVDPIENEALSPDVEASVVDEVEVNPWDAMVEGFDSYQGAEAAANPVAQAFGVPSLTPEGPVTKAAAIAAMHSILYKVGWDSIWSLILDFPSALPGGINLQSDPLEPIATALNPARILGELDRFEPGGQVRQFVTWLCYLAAFVFLFGVYWTNLRSAS